MIDKCHTRDAVKFVTEAIVLRCSVNFAKFLRPLFLHLRWLLLLLDEIQNIKKMKTRESKERKFEKKVREIG